MASTDTSARLPYDLAGHVAQVIAFLSSDHAHLIKANVVHLR